MADNKGFKLWRDDDVKKMASKLKETQLGWIDPKIASKMITRGNSNSMECWYCGIPSNAMPFDFCAKMPQVVSSDDFILGHKEEHIEKLSAINKKINEEKLGSLLYYDFHNCGIRGYMMVFPPIEVNIQKIKEILQNNIDKMAERFANYKDYPENFKWAVSLSSVEDGDDINATIRQQYNQLFNVV